MMIKCGNQIIKVLVLLSITPLEFFETSRFINAFAQYTVNCACDLKCSIGGEMNSGRKKRVYKAGRIANKCQAWPPEARVVIRIVHPHTYFAVYAIGKARRPTQQITHHRATAYHQSQ